MTHDVVHTVSVEVSDRISSIGDRWSICVVGLIR